MVKDQTVRADNAKASVMTKLVADQDYKERLNTRKKENEVLHKNTLQYKATQHEKQANFRANLKEKEKKRQPFVAKINEQSLAKATVFRQNRQAMEERQRQMNSLEFAAL